MFDRGLGKKEIIDEWGSFYFQGIRVSVPAVTLDQQGAPVLFLIRAVLSLLLAIIISRFFFQSGGWMKTIILAAIMFFLAYLFEFAKRRDKGGGHGD